MILGIIGLLSNFVDRVLEGRIMNFIFLLSDVSLLSEVALLTVMSTFWDL